MSHRTPISNGRPQTDIRKLSFNAILQTGLNHDKRVRQCPIEMKRPADDSCDEFGMGAPQYGMYSDSGSESSSSVPAPKKQNVSEVDGSKKWYRASLQEKGAFRIKERKLKKSPMNSHRVIPGSLCTFLADSQLEPRGGWLNHEEEIEFQETYGMPVSERKAWYEKKYNDETYGLDYEDYERFENGTTEDEWTSLPPIERNKWRRFERIRMHPTVYDNELGMQRFVEVTSAQGMHLGYDDEVIAEIVPNFLDANPWEWGGYLERDETLLQETYGFPLEKRNRFHRRLYRYNNCVKEDLQFDAGNLSADSDTDEALGKVFKTLREEYATRLEALSNQWKRGTTSKYKGESDTTLLLQNPVLPVEKRDDWFSTNYYKKLFSCEGMLVDPQDSDGEKTDSYGCGSQ